MLFLVPNLQQCDSSGGNRCTSLMFPTLYLFHSAVRNISHTRDLETSEVWNQDMLKSFGSIPGQRDEPRLSPRIIREVCGKLLNMKPPPLLKIHNRGMATRREESAALTAIASELRQMPENNQTKAGGNGQG